MLRAPKNKTFSIFSQCFFRQCSFPPVYVHSCASASYLKVSTLVLSSPFPIDLLVCSEAVLLRSVSMLLGLPGAEYLRTFWSLSLYGFYMFKCYCSYLPRQLKNSCLLIDELASHAAHLNGLTKNLTGTCGL